MLKFIPNSLFIKIGIGIIIAIVVGVIIWVLVNKRPKYSQEIKTQYIQVPTPLNKQWRFKSTNSFVSLDSWNVHYSGKLNVVRFKTSAKEQGSGKECSSVELYISRSDDQQLRSSDAEILFHKKINIARTCPEGTNSECSNEETIYKKIEITTNIDPVIEVQEGDIVKLIIDTSGPDCELWMKPITIELDIRPIV